MTSNPWYSVAQTIFTKRTEIIMTTSFVVVAVSRMVPKTIELVMRKAQ